VVTPEQVADFLGPMPVANLRGLGRQTARIFERLGIRTVAQLREVPLEVLQRHLGPKAAAGFLRQSRGIASDRVEPERGRKSISKETTFEQDIRDPALLHDTLRRLAAEVAGTARREGLSGSVVTLKIRFTGFETHSRQHRRSAATQDEREILKTAWQLFLGGRLPDKPVRLIGVGISGWETDRPAQADLFSGSGATEDDRRLLQTIDAVAAKFGRGKLQVGIPPRGRK